MRISTRLVCCFASLTGFCGANSLHAAFVDPSNATARSTVPWTRPADSDAASATLSTYQEWDVFGSATATNLPNTPGVTVSVNGSDLFPNVAAAPKNPNGGATLLQTDPGAFLTSGGNIYSPTTVTAFSLNAPNYAASGQWTSYLLQLRTLGTELASNSFTINGTPISSLANYSFESVSTGAGMGASTEYQFEFTLPANSPFDVIAWNASGSSTSMDKISLDTIAVAPIGVPEPSTWALLVLASVGVVGIRRRRAKQV